jgi:hypothetical protein
MMMMMMMKSHKEASQRESRYHRSNFIEYFVKPNYYYYISRVQESHWCELPRLWFLARKNRRQGGTL